MNPVQQEMNIKGLRSKFNNAVRSQHILIPQLAPRDDGFGSGSKVQSYYSQKSAGLQKALKAQNKISQQVQEDQIKDFRQSRTAVGAHTFSGTRNHSASNLGLRREGEFNTNLAKVYQESKGNCVLQGDEREIDTLEDDRGYKSSDLGDHVSKQNATGSSLLDELLCSVKQDPTSEVKRLRVKISNLEDTLGDNRKELAESSNSRTAVQYHFEDEAEFAKSEVLQGNRPGSDYYDLEERFQNNSH